MELIEEVAESTTLAQRRQFIADIAKTQGEESAEQLRRELKRYWEHRK